MSKRPAIDLSSITSESAAPMPEAAQRTAKPTPRFVPPAPAALPEPPPPAVPVARDRVPVERGAPLTFKVSPDIRMRFRLNAAKSGLKLNELLIQALEAWEEKNP